MRITLTFENYSLAQPSGSLTSIWPINWWDCLQALDTNSRDLARPYPEQFTMAFYERLSLKLRKRFPVFIGLGCPHSAHSAAAEVPETLNLLDVVGEVESQREPMGIS